MVDASQHHAWATRTANGCVLGAGPDDVFKPPLYPALVGLVYWLAGPKVAVVQAGQFLLGAVGAVLTAVLGARLFGRFVGAETLHLGRDP